MIEKLEDCRILLVDDDQDTRILLTTVLEMEGATVLAVGSAIAALNALEQFQPDLLLSDIVMPGIDGYSLLKQIRSQPQWNYLPAIAFTALSGTRYEEQSIRAGFQVHLEKPIDFEPLIQAIQSLVPMKGTVCSIRTFDSALNPPRLSLCGLQLSA
ncbi:response regulator [Cyanobacteria bacterium FACHB-63]|nr:response regulator [Cyanobacteria bacterium FACHB-63]